MGIGKDQLIFDTSSLVDSDNVGAYVRSSDGSLITKHSVASGEKASLIAQGLVFKSKLEGAIGNSYSFQVIDSTGSGPLSFTEVAGAIVLDLNGLTPTTAAVASFLAANSYVDITVGTPTGNVIVAAAQSLSGGANSSIHKHLDVYSPLVDGSGNPITSTNGSLNANITNTVAISASNLDIRDLVFATDKVDVSGSEVSLDSATLAALENITVSATDLDIRNLVFATDKVDVSGSVIALDSTTLAALENITVSATDLDIRDLAFATDKVDVSGSTVELGATTLAALENITVSATDFDIRNLDYSQDNIAIKGATGNQLVVNADGSINVSADISVVNGHEKLEDAAHSSGDVGSYVLAVRQDTLAASTSTDGDYSSLKTSAAGALYVNLAESSATITTSDAALANTAIVANANTLSVADTAQAAVASPLANRKYLSIYNSDNSKIYIGGAGVTAATGFPVSPGSVIELRAGAASAVNFVGSAGKTPAIRHLELS